MRKVIFREGYFLAHIPLLESLAMVSYQYSFRRRRLNEAQLLQIAAALNDIAQVIIAAFFIPFLFGEVSFLRAFAGAFMAILLWFSSLVLLRACRN